MISKETLRMAVRATVDNDPREAELLTALEEACAQRVRDGASEAEALAQGMADVAERIRASQPPVRRPTALLILGLAVLLLYLCVALWFMPASKELFAQVGLTMPGVTLVMNEVQRFWPVAAGLAGGVAFVVGVQFRKGARLRKDEIVLVVGILILILILCATLYSTHAVISSLLRGLGPRR